MIYAVA